MASYRIKISTSIESRLKGISAHVKYPKCKAEIAGDKFTFRSSCIIIECNRSNLQKKEEIENNPGNTLRIQIMRALLLYYAANVQKARVYSICVSQVTKMGKKVVTELIYNKPAEQPLRLIGVPPIYQYPITDLVQNILADDSHLYETIMSHWLGAWVVKGRYEQFERLWRCLEQLSVKSYHGAAVESTEKNCLTALRTYIISHSASFPIACAHVDAMDYNEFRSFFWKLLIFNNFKKTAKIGRYVDYRDLFVLPYHDERVVKMLKDTLVYRHDELDGFGFLDAVNNHITSVLASPQKKNEDVVAILSGYYAYYTRNKIFHGELSERSFNICGSHEDDVIDKLNALMVKVTFELIKIFQLL